MNTFTHDETEQLLSERSKIMVAAGEGHTVGAISGTPEWEHNRNLEAHIDEWDAAHADFMDGLRAAARSDRMQDADNCGTASGGGYASFA